MELSYILVVYLIILISLIFIFYKFGIKLGGSIISSLIISQILLNLIMPPSNVNLEEEPMQTYCFYLLIQFLTPIIVYIYALVVATDGKRQSCNSCDAQFLDINFLKI